MLALFNKVREQERNRIDQAMIETTTYRLVAYFAHEDHRIFTDVQLKDEVDAILNHITFIDGSYTIAGNMIKFILDNDYDFDETKLSIVGTLNTNIDDLDENKINTLKFNGYKALKQVYKSKKIDFNSVEWTIAAKPYMRPVK